MPRDEDLLAWMVLSRAPKLNAAALSQAFARLTDHCAGDEAGAARHLLRASPAAQKYAGLAAATREFLGAASSTAGERAWARAPGHCLLPFNSERFPRQLLQENQGNVPIALYLDGHTDVLAAPQVAIVGSRNPSPQGRDIAAEFAAALARCGLAITSGLAEGIDAAAHAGALQGAGATVAVLGCGIDVGYPRCNAALRDRIRAQGVLLSQFPLGAAPRAAHFPRRNAIIAGLSMGTLVIEAALRSGSLITARLAVEGGREVFAVPGSIRNPLSQGCHQLLRQGATLVESPADVLAELNFSPSTAPFGALPTAREAVHGHTPGMDKDQKILLDALGFDPADLDALVVRTGFEPQTVSSMMLILELDGHVQAAPGGRFSRVVRSRGER